MADIPISLSEVLSVTATFTIFQPYLGGPCIGSETPTKHENLKLLDGIALLLVTEGASDVAAAAVTNHVKDGLSVTKFHVMKGRECSAQECRYYHDLVKILNDHDISTMEDALFELVVANCRNQILTRSTKVQRAVKECDIAFSTWVDPSERMKAEISQFREVYQPSTPCDSWPELLDDFLTKGLHPDKFRNNNTGKPLRLAFWFVHTRSLSERIRSDKLEMRLAELGAYASILMKLTRMAKHGRGRRVVELEIVSLDEVFFSRRYH